MRAHIDSLREQYPNLPPGYFDMMAEKREAEEQLHDLRRALSGLVGYYSREGAIPVEEVCKLIGTSNDEAEGKRWR